MAKSQSPRYVPNKALSNQKQAIYIGEQYFPMQNKLFKKFCDANLVITWSRNPQAKTSIPEKPTKSGLIGV
jgi:hypothetical protein